MGDLKKEFSERMVLVTGGAGFIGSEVVNQLCNFGAKVTVLDNFISGKREYLKNLDVEIIRADICDKRAVFDIMRDQEIVFHLAALPFIPDCYLDPEEFFRINTMGTVNVLWEAIQSESAKKFIHISTSEVYGTARYVPMDENHPTLPHSTYAVSKLAAEKAVFTMHKEQGFPVAIVRPFNSYGPRITQPYIIPEIITQLLQDGNLKLGNVESSRDFTYVEDTAMGIQLAGVKKEAVGETINIGSGKDYKIKELAMIIAELMGKKDKLKITLDEGRVRPYDVGRLICKNEKAWKLLGWKPKVSIEEGLKRTVEWVKNNKIEFKEPFRGWPRLLRKSFRSNVK